MWFKIDSMENIIDIHGKPLISKSYIPKIYMHDLSYLGIDSREICNCCRCTTIKKRRDSIYKNKWYYKIFK